MEWFLDEAKRICAALAGAPVDGDLTADQREVLKVLRKIDKPATERELKRPSRKIQKMENLGEVLRQLIAAKKIQDHSRENGAIEYGIFLVDAVDVDTSSKFPGENRRAVNVNAVNSDKNDSPAPPLLEGAESPKPRKRRERIIEDFEAN